METNLRNLGLPHEITLLSSAEATYDRVVEVLRDGRYHIFHYAGHGRFDDVLPEVSGLVLRHEQSVRTLTAADLRLLAQDTELRLVYLSCCLGTRSAQDTTHGDFHGMMEALALADVPTVLGFRWSVRDNAAQLMALVFYQHLWRVFSPGQALLEARRSAAMELGHDEYSWASPVLLTQNAD